MSVKMENPYREGQNYHRIMAKVIAFSSGGMAKSGFTRESIVKFTRTLKGRDGNPLTEAAVQASVNVILSPRLSAREGCDCRGNMSAMGHLYYIEAFRRPIKNHGKVVMIKGEPKTEKRYILRYRETALEPNKRPYISKKVVAESEVKVENKETVEA